MRLTFGPVFRYRSRTTNAKIKTGQGPGESPGDRKTKVPLTEEDRLREQLEALRIEHRDLDDVIERMLHSATVDMIQIQRLKKRKLVLKDQITQIESRILPDIIA